MCMQDFRPVFAGNKSTRNSIDQCRSRHDCQSDGALAVIADFGTSRSGSWSNSQLHRKLDDFNGRIPEIQWPKTANDMEHEKIRLEYARRICASHGFIC